MKYKSIMCLNELVFNGKHYQNGLICYKTNGLMVQNFNILSISILLFKGLPLFGFFIFLIQKYPYTFMFK